MNAETALKAAAPFGKLEEARRLQLEEDARRCCGWAISMTTVANSGHPAGSLSSMRMYMAVYDVANITSENCDEIDRDYVVISHGHTSPAAYAALANCGFIEPDVAVANFRRAGSVFQGHVERSVPGIDWGSGNLGQGLSAAAGYAIAQKARGYDGNVFVLMGDGEQPKGQIAEARRMISSNGLANVTVLVDYNHIQISGRIEEVLPVNIRALWEADGWNVLECDGHSFDELYSSLGEALSDDRPTVILCHTIMGKGVSFMEDVPDYHGKAPSGDLYEQAMRELGQPSMIERAKNLRQKGLPVGRALHIADSSFDLGVAREYGPEERTDNRSAFGNALLDMGRLNYGSADRTPLLVFDCDLAGSVKTASYCKECPDWFIECGIQEHNTATAAGAASCGGVISLWADFGVFGMCEVYNQQRLNDINHTNLKVVLTHVGLDVGEDGMTHQCIDYIGLANNTFGWKLVVPADPNQTDRATRWAVGVKGNVCLAMGRSKLDAITGGDGGSLFGDGYEFEYGRAALVRDGKDATIFALGAMTSRALSAAEELFSRGIDVKVYSVSCPLVVDDKALEDALSTGAIVTIEDHNVKTGMGSIMASRIAELGLAVKFRPMGVARYGDSGNNEEVISRMGLDAQGIVETMTDLLGK